MAREIQYSDKYYDDCYEYRHVVLPQAIAQHVPTGRLLSEPEWRGLGVQQSRGWIHYHIHKPEPHILLFRRQLTPESAALAGQQAQAQEMQRQQQLLALRLQQQQQAAGMQHQQQQYQMQLQQQAQLEQQQQQRAQQSHLDYAENTQYMNGGRI